jgi:hypothetical protein
MPRELKEGLPPSSPSDFALKASISLEVSIIYDYLELWSL